MTETIIDLSTIRDAFVIHYGGRLNEVKANTFANSLICLSNILDEINQEVNPNYKIEIIIEALGPGSFRPKIKLSAQKIKDLFGEYVKKDQIIMILIGLLSLKLCGGPDKQNITITDSQVVIAEKTKKIIMPKEVYEYTENIYNNVKVQKNIQNHFNILEDDTSITDFGIYEKLEDTEPLFQVPKDDFQKVGGSPIQREDEFHKVETERVTLQVTRTILEKKRRRWEFIYRGIRIPATIESDTFYQEMEKGMKFGLGDSVDVTLEIHKFYNKSVNAWENESYVITEFFGYKEAQKQTSLIN